MKESKCPICGKTTFNNEFEICRCCGWEHDLVQEEDPKFAGGANDLSLLEYKRLYKIIIDKHPRYVWELNQNALVDITSKLLFPPYLCKCCGKELINNVGDKCSICGWIDSPLQNLYTDMENLINHNSLEHYIKKCKEKESN